MSNPESLENAGLHYTGRTPTQLISKRVGTCRPEPAIGPNKSKREPGETRRKCRW